MLETVSDNEFEWALARQDYEFYVECIHKGIWKPARHLSYVNERLQKVEAGEVTRLMIFMPPRHGKSMDVTETFPSYFIGRNPERRVIAVSYGDHLARRFGRRNRQKIEEYGPAIFGIDVSRDNASMTDWGIDGHRGGMISAGIGGPITGEGADLLLIDDPIKNRQEAQSEAYREMLWDEWQSTLLTRLAPTGAVILIMTRWHEDDLAGRLLEQEGHEWEVISLPAKAEEDDPLGRAIGDPLWPEGGFGAEWLAKKEAGVGPQVWVSLYQQRPAPDEGDLIKRHWFRFWQPPGLNLGLVLAKLADGTIVECPVIDLPASFDQQIQSWDMAFKDTKSSDFVVGQVWGRVGANKFLLDQVRDRLSFPNTLEAVKNLTAKWPRAIAKLVEDKANGPAVISTLQSKITGLIPKNPEGGKEVRATAVSPEIRSGNVYLPHPSLCEWVNDFLLECSAFPNGTHDDQVDAMSQALLEFQNQPMIFIGRA